MRFSPALLLSLMTLGAIFIARRALLRREGRLASLGWLNGSLFLIGMLIFMQAFYLLANISNAVDLATPIPTADDLRGSVISFLPCGCTLGMIFIVFLSLWNWRDLTRWFPARS